MKRLTSLALLAALSTTLTAGGDIEPQCKTVEEAEVMHHESPYYVVIKGLYTLGDDVSEEDAVLDGDSGYGVGIDFGYRLDHGFAVEFDFSYDTDTVTERKEGEAPREYDADFYTAAIDVVYTYEATQNLGVFAKAGYEFEWADIDELGNENDSGAVFGVGFEYAVDETYKAVVEYEHSAIDSARGDAIFAGVMINF